MAGRLALTVATAMLAGAGCGDGDRSLPAACTEEPDVIARALADAPGPVALDDGTRLSDCVTRATREGELQEFGAARRGARRTTGVHAELVRRLEQTATLEGAPASRLRAVERGVVAGERYG